MRQSQIHTEQNPSVEDLVQSFLSAINTMLPLRLLIIPGIFFGIWLFLHSLFIQQTNLAQRQAIVKMV
jgi:hypothetical protein